MDSLNFQKADRRKENRPVNGDRAVCSSCGSRMRFNERYVVTRLGITTAQPVWVCYCGVEAYVRPMLVPSRFRGPVEHRLASGVGVAPEDLSTMRHLLAYIREQASQGPTTAMRDFMRQTLAQIKRCPLVILAADDSGRCVAANEATCALTGHSERELLDMHVWDLSIAPSTARHQRMWRRFIRAGGFVGEYHLRRKAGAPIRVPCMAAAHIIKGMHVAMMTPRQAHDIVAARRTRLVSGLRDGPDRVDSGVRRPDRLLSALNEPFARAAGLHMVERCK